MAAEIAIKTDDQITRLPVKKILNDEDFNSRGHIMPLDVITLASNIKDNGLLQPILVQPWDRAPGFDYRIVLGHRRYEACKQLRWEDIPAVIRVGLSEADALALNLIENIERRQLNIVQEANAANRFRLIGLTYGEIASRLGMSSGWVQTRMGLLTLPIEIQREAAAGALTTEQIKVMCGMSRDDQFEALRTIKDANLTGDKVKLKVAQKRKEKGDAKKVRNATQIEEMQDFLIDAIGNSIATRALGWASGWVSNLELMQSIKVWADQNGKPFEIPDHFLE